MHRLSGMVVHRGSLGHLLGLLGLDILCASPCTPRGGVIMIIFVLAANVRAFEDYRARQPAAGGGVTMAVFQHKDRTHRSVSRWWGAYQRCDWFAPPSTGLVLLWGLVEYGHGAAGWHVWLGPWCCLGSDRRRGLRVSVKWGRD